MSQCNPLARWAVTGRWLAILGIGLVVAFSYGLFQSAHAQDRGPKAAGNRASGKPAAPPSKTADALMTPQEAAAKAARDINAAEPEKTAGAEPTKEGDTASILHDINWISPHMWAFYAIWFVSIIAVAFAVERFLGLRRRRILPSPLAAGLRALAARKGELDLRHAERLCNQYPSSMAIVARAMLAKAGRPLPEVEHAMSEACDREATRLYTNVRVQNLAFNVAPMLGLAGTVHGVILCFYTTAHLKLGENRFDALATGIYAALICTLAGLIVAIPAGILGHYFESRILKMFQKVEDVARALAPQLERFEGRPRHFDSGDNLPPSAAAGAARNGEDFQDDSLPAPKPKRVENRP